MLAAALDPYTPITSEESEPGHRPRVVLMVHGHPDYSAGGAEMAAYSLYKALAEESPDDTHLVAWVSPKRLKTHARGSITRLQPGHNEWLYHSEPAEWLFSLSANRATLHNGLIAFLKELAPDVVHLHHFLGFGMDALRMIRLELPDAKLVMTLHEYLAICLRDGQMVTTNENKLCTAASPVRCSGCFPHLYRSHFALREEWFRRHLALVDQFISPSQFLKDRYVAWGVPEEKIAVVENAQICVTNPPPPERKIDLDLKTTFAFFGQLNPYKGADVLMDAAAALQEMLEDEDEKADLADQPRLPRPHIVIYGTTGHQSDEFKAKLAARLEELKGVVEYRGAYGRHEVIDLMTSAGWVLVPSTWWENSPVVIEEAFHARRPVICADIGGMAEKVENGVNGLHFRARDPRDLARVMLGCLREPQRWDALSAGARRLPTLRESAEQHYALYAE
jgi:glycosyltransferase involved in cell wall biosynthesis